MMQQLPMIEKAAGPKSLESFDQIMDCTVILVGAEDDPGEEGRNAVP